MPHHVRLHIRIRIGQRMAHSSLRSQMHNRLDRRVTTDQLVDRLPISDIRAVEGKSRLSLQACQPRLLQPDVVIVVEVVHADYARAARQQRLSHMIADEPRDPGQQNTHRGRATSRSSNNSSTAWPSEMWHSWI